MWIEKFQPELLPALLANINSNENLFLKIFRYIKINKSKTYVQVKKIIREIFEQSKEERIPISSMLIILLQFMQGIKFIVDWLLFDWLLKLVEEAKVLLKTDFLTFVSLGLFAIFGLLDWRKLSSCVYPYSLFL